MASEPDAMTPDEYRRGHLMMSAVFRTLTKDEREELVRLLEPKGTTDDRA